MKTKFTSVSSLIKFSLISFLFLIFAPGLYAQYQVPELIYYKFDETGSAVTNAALTPVGNNPAPILGLTQGGTGQFGGALQGVGGSSSSYCVNSGWPIMLTNPAGFTISLWMNNMPYNTSLYYLFEDATATSFRCFIGGAAGPGNIIIRGGGLPDLIVSRISGGPHVVHFVWDGSHLLGYRDGVLVKSIYCTYTDVTGVAGPFKVGGYSTSTGMPSGSRIDEFRIYDRALTAEEISATWNIEISNDVTPPVITTITGPVVLWPPNHQYETFVLEDFVTSVWDDFASLTIDDVNIVKATSDEPEDAEGNGDGNTLDDIVISGDCKSVQLRNERDGTGNGRVYTIFLELDDGNGNTGSATCQVHVPHNTGETAIDDGAVYEVLAVCGNGPSFPLGIKNPVSEIKLINYPNPFNSSTKFVFSVKEARKTTLKLYNFIGKEVRVLFDGYAEAGQNHKIIFHGEGLPEELYICHMQSGDEHRARRIVLVK